MRLFVMVFAGFVLFGCSSGRNAALDALRDDDALGSLRIVETADPVVDTAPLVPVGAMADASAMPALRPSVALAPEMAAPPATPPADDDRPRRRGDSYFMLKGGWVGQSDEDLGNGYIITSSVGTFVAGRIFAVEIEGGWTESDQDKSNIDLTTAPIMLNGRLNLPIWILEIYGGAGLGGVYYDFEVGGGARDRDGWVFGGNAFVGADLVVFDAISAGVELKYFATDETRVNDNRLNALAAMITVGLRF